MTQTLSIKIQKSFELSMIVNNFFIPSITNESHGEAMIAFLKPCAFEGIVLIEGDRSKINLGEIYDPIYLDSVILEEESFDFKPFQKIRLSFKNSGTSTTVDRSHPFPSIPAGRITCIQQDN